MAGLTRDIQSWSDFTAVLDADVISLLGLDDSQQKGSDSTEQLQSKNDFCDNLRVDNIADQPLHFTFSHTSLDQKLLNSVCSSSTGINSHSGVQPSCLPTTLAVSPPTVTVAELFATSHQGGRGESEGKSSNKLKGGDKNS
ncbi:uncharacterized protein LOC144913289 [Branchiostoma floridae x Branchiostoma belcheri]